MRAIQVLSAASMRDWQAFDTEDRQQTFRINLLNVRSKTALIQAVGTGMGLPDYLGSNWDALEECLRDLKEQNGWLLVFENADDLLLLPSSQLSTFLSILKDTIEFWKNEGRSFRVALIGSPALASVVEDIGAEPAPA